MAKITNLTEWKYQQMRKRIDEGFTNLRRRTTEINEQLDDKKTKDKPKKVDVTLHLEKTEETEDILPDLNKISFFQEILPSVFLRMRDRPYKSLKTYDYDGMKKRGGRIILDVVNDRVQSFSFMIMHYADVPYISFISCPGGWETLSWKEKSQESMRTTAVMYDIWDEDSWLINWVLHDKNDPRLLYFTTRKERLTVNEIRRLFIPIILRCDNIQHSRISWFRRFLWKLGYRK